MNEFLVITAIGADRPGIVDDLSRILLDNNLNIEDSRMSVLGGEFAVMLLVSGNWSTVAKLQSALPALEKSLGMTIVSKQTERRARAQQTVPYAADVVSIDHPGIVNNLAHFFSERDINIEELREESTAGQTSHSTLEN